MAELFDPLAGRTRLCTLLQYFIAFCSRPEAASEVISGRFLRPIVPDKCAKFRDPCSTRSREIPPGAVGGGTFDRKLTTGIRDAVE